LRPLIVELNRERLRKHHFRPLIVELNRERLRKRSPVADPEFLDTLLNAVRAHPILVLPHLFHLCYRVS
jgi:hypothetical protein